jgi:hypothetical protein
MPSVEISFRIVVIVYRHRRTKNDMLSVTPCSGHQFSQTSLSCRLPARTPLVEQINQTDPSQLFINHNQNNYCAKRILCQACIRVIDPP